MAVVRKASPVSAIRTVLLRASLWVALVSVFLPSFHADETATGLALSRNGQSRYCIVLDAEATEPEQVAATELSRYLQQVTGGTFPVVWLHEAGGDDGRIYVGPSRTVQKILPDLDWDALGEDTIVISFVDRDSMREDPDGGTDIVLAGAPPRGTLYAVYTFLEQAVGCRWWTSTESDIPRKPTLTIDRRAAARMYSPPIKYREEYFRDTFGWTILGDERPEEYLFAVKLKLNGHAHHVPRKHGSHYTILGWCHTFHQLIPPEKYFDGHPEWFALVRGKRVRDKQLCLTNEEMRRELVRNALEWIREDPEAGIISISQNDTDGPCQCPKCQEIAREEGAESGPLIRFVNAVAADIEKEYPDFKVMTLAYMYSQKSPLHIHPRRNVVIRLCSMRADHFRPLGGPGNRQFAADLKRWSEISHQVFIWDYVVNFRNFVTPYPNLGTLGTNMRLFADSGAYGVFSQGNGWSKAGDFYALRAWVIARLLWDPTLDTRRLVDEFVSGYYGPAAPFIREYLDFVHDAFMKSRLDLETFHDKFSYATPKFMTKATRLFDRACNAVGDNPQRLRRVRQARLQVDYLWLRHYKDLKEAAEQRGVPFTGPKDLTKAYYDFVRAANDLGAYYRGEGRPLRERLLKIRKKLGVAPLLAGVPERCRNLASEDWLDIQDPQFRLTHVGQAVWDKADPSASDGFACWMPGGHELRVLECRPEVPWRARGYAVVRCRAGATTGTAFRLVVEGRDGAEPIEQTVSVDEAADGRYHEFDLGVFDASQWKERAIYVVPPGRDEIDGIFVDRFFFVRE